MDVIESREYQNEAVNLAIDFFRNGDPKDKPLVIAPTGSGKSVVVARIANELKADVLVIQPSKELLAQNYAKYSLYGGHATIYSASFKTKEVGDITFAMIGSIKSKAGEFAHVKYIIIDECHLLPPRKNTKKTRASMFMDFLEGMPGVKVLGLTATPFRLKKYRDPWTGAPIARINLLMRERPMFFNKFLHITQIAELFAKGYLTPIVYEKLRWSGSALKLNTTGAEYSEESIKEAIEKEEVLERLPEIIRQSMDQGRKYRIVFVHSVLTAQLLAKRVPDSAYVSSDTPDKERDQIVKDFKAGKIRTVFNVNILTTGFDFPELDNVIIARPTMSLTIYMQMIGREIRKFPGKETCSLIDMCGNVDRFGKIEDIQYCTDLNGKWVIKSNDKILSGVNLG